MNFSTPRAVVLLIQPSLLISVVQVLSVPVLRISTRAHRRHGGRYERTQPTGHREHFCIEGCFCFFNLRFTCCRWCNPITTKSGKKGKTSINYNNSFRFDSPLNMPEMMDSYTWAKYMNAASVGSGAGVWFTDEKLGADQEGSERSYHAEDVQEQQQPWGGLG